MSKAGQLRAFAMIVAAALALCLMALVAAKPAEAAFPGKNGKIAFVSNRDAGAGEIYTTKPDGTGTTRITFPTGGSSDPAFSPDGTKIAFKSASRTNYEISVMNADGTGRVQITNTPVVESEPAWSSDGTKIAFVAGISGTDTTTDSEIWTMNADGTGRVQITNNTFPDRSPAWSPDGTKIAFVSARTGDTNNNVYVMNADGTAQVSLTPNTTDPLYQGHDEDPTWSPDGSKIAYVHNRESNGGGVPNIWTMDPNGAGKTNLTNSSVSGTEPAWSPNGTRIAYVGATDTNRNIYVMNANGTGQAPIADLRHDISPDWQQDSIPPQTTISSGPPALTKSTSASFGFVSSETGSTFQCSLDGAPFAACASPKSYTVANGTHTLRVMATDVAGNTDATPAARSWTVDTIKPTVSGMRPVPGSITSDRTPAIRATVKDNLTNLVESNIKLYVNGVRIAATKFSYSSSTDLLAYNSPTLPAGKKTVKVVATDRVGNVGVKSWSFTIR